MLNSREKDAADAGTPGRPGLRAGARGDWKGKRRAAAARIINAAASSAGSDRRLRSHGVRAWDGNKIAATARAATAAYEQKQREIRFFIASSAAWQSPERDPQLCAAGLSRLCYYRTELRTNPRQRPALLTASRKPHHTATAPAPSGHTPHAHTRTASV